MNESIPTQATAGNRNARDQALLALFALSLAWALFQVWVWLTLSGKRGETDAGAVQEWGPAVVAVVLAGFVTVFLMRVAPRFLRAPARVSSLRLWLTLIVTAAIVAVTMLVVTLAVTMIIDPPGPRADVQYVPIGFWIAPWAVIALTPLAAVLIAWAWTTRTKEQRPTEVDR